MENKIPELIQKLASESSIDRIRARYELVKIGKPAIEYLIGLQYLNTEHVRWEAIKTLSQIAHPDAIPILINALENDRFDVRWLAAEGLIEIGKQSILPLLEALETQQDSKFLREGVHHVLRALKSKNIFKDKYQIIKMIEDSNTNSLLALTAHKILSEEKISAT